MKIFALVVFIACYAVMITKPKYRPAAAAVSAVLFIVTGLVPAAQLLEVIDFNVLLMIAGMMITVFFFIDSKMPLFIADVLMDKSKNICVLTIYLSLFAGVISAFVDNVATVLMVAPVAIAIAKKKQISPVPMVISIAVSSNLQGAATLVGDTTSIMLGAYAKMNFMDFFVMLGRPGIFWAVEFGALATVPVMLILFRDMKEPIEADERTKVSTYVPGLALLGIIVTMIIVSFFPNRPALANGMICMVYAVICVVYYLVKEKKPDVVLASLKDVDYQTLILLASLFVVVEGINRAGIIDDIASVFVKVGSNHYFLLYTLLVWGSVAISAFIDNIPYVSAMLPVVSSMAAMMGIEPYLLYFGLLCGATLGGNLTPIGASANITANGILRREGYEVSNGTFMRISVPFTLTAVTVGYVFLWIFWR